MVPVDFMSGECPIGAGRAVRKRTKGEKREDLPPSHHRVKVILATESTRALHDNSGQQEQRSYQVDQPWSLQRVCDSLEH